jgi:hypothetical protein
MASPPQGLQVLPPSDEDIPIDPALLALDLEDEPSSDESEAEQGELDSDSSIEDNDALDAYGEEEGRIDLAVESVAGRIDADDEVFRCVCRRI